MNRDYDGEQALLEISRLQRQALEYDLDKLERESEYQDKE